MDRRPQASEFAEYYGRYIAQLPDGPVVATLERQRKEMAALLASVPEDRERFRYAPGKWSLREVVGHVIDAERVFAVRALAFARGDRGPLPSFDENAYAAGSGADDRPLADHAAEWDAVRRSSVLLFGGLRPEDWSRVGVASGNEFTVRSLAWIIGGHAQHHITLIADQYLGSGA